MAYQENTMEKYLFNNNNGVCVNTSRLVNGAQMLCEFNAAILRTSDVVIVSLRRIRTEK